MYPFSFVGFQKEDESQGLSSSTLSLHHTVGHQYGQALAFDIYPGLLEPLCLLTILGMEFLLLRNAGVF